MKLFALLLLSSGLVTAFAVFAAAPNQEIHIFSDGSVHITAELFRKNSLNFFTLRAWNIKWEVPIDVTNTNIRIESAYGAKIDLKEIEEGHVLEIKGKLPQNIGFFEPRVDPALIRDLSIKTGESPPAPPLPPAPPTPLEADRPKAVVAPPSVGRPLTGQALTMTLKPGYWGGQVKILQEFLKKQGYFPKKEPTSRYFGSLTKNALMDFQAANSLEAVGALGPKTRALINSLLK